MLPKKTPKRLTGRKYQKLAYKVRERDGNCCILCGRGAGHVHHIVFRSQGGEDKMSNLVTLCERCHQEAHGVGRCQHSQEEIREILLQYAKG